MIIVEGPDGVGKSTLAKALARMHKMPVVCFSPLPDWWRPEHYLTRSCMQFAVYDRLHWSAYAYREVREQPWDATVPACVDLDDALKSRCNGSYTKILIICSEPNFFDQIPEDDMFKREQVKSVNHRFMEIANHFDIVHDITNGWADCQTILMPEQLVKQTNVERATGLVK